MQDLGQVLTREDRLLVFPNVLLHRVQPFELSDATKPGHRKLLALFLVDPYIKIPSTANIPPQQKAWWTKQVIEDGALERLPPELVEYILDGVDMLVAQKIADPSRLGIGGWSYGGFMAAWAVTHGDRFKAAVVGAGPTDMVAMARITDTPDFPLGYFGDLETHLADYQRASSAYLTGRVTASVLVLHGEQDTRVPPVLGLDFYRGLRMAGKPAEMVRYPREPHWFHERAHQEDVQRRVLAWFDRYL